MPRRGHLPSKPPKALPGPEPSWYCDSLIRYLGGITMPALKNPRHEAFAQALARGMSASAAYVEAGYKASTTDALG
jgi:hypothetical protein